MAVPISATVDKAPEVGQSECTNPTGIRKNAECMLEEHLTWPEHTSKESAVEDFLYLRTILEQNPQQARVLYNRFLRHLGGKLDSVMQVDLLLLGLQAYPFLHQQGCVSYEPVWILIRALRLGGYRRDIQDKVSDMELQLICHPLIKEKQTKAIRKLLEALHVAMAGDEAEFKNQMQTCLEVAARLCKIGMIDRAREIYQGLSEILRTAHQGMKNWDIRGMYAKIIREKINGLPLRSTQVEVKWLAFHEAYQALKRSCQQASEFKRKRLELLGEIFHYCRLLLEPLTLCDFEPLLKGSIGGAALLSDIDCGILVSEKVKVSDFARDTLPSYLALVRFYLGCLDDAWIVDGSDQRHYPIKRIGVDIDPGDVEQMIGTREIQLAPYQEGVQNDSLLLVKTPEKMFLWMTEEFYLNEKEDLLLPVPYSLFHTELICGSSANLYQRLQERLNGWRMDAGRRRQLCEKFIAYNIKKYQDADHASPYAQLKRDGYIWDIKQSWLQPIALGLSIIGFFLGYPRNTPVEDIPSRIQDDYPSTSYFFAELATGLRDLQVLRWVCHLDWPYAADGGDPNEVFVKSPPLQYHSSQRLQLVHLKSGKIAELPVAKNTLLKPLYAILEHLGVDKPFPDPLEVMCKKQLSCLDLPLSEGQGLQIFTGILNQRIMSIPEINGISAIGRLNAGQLMISFPEYLEKWIIGEYSKQMHPRGRIAWLNQLLNIEALFLIKRAAMQHFLRKLAGISFEGKWSLIASFNACKKMLAFTTYSTCASNEIGDTPGFFLQGRCPSSLCQPKQRAWIPCGDRGSLDIHELESKAACTHCRSRFEEIEKIAVSNCGGILEGRTEDDTRFSEEIYFKSGTALVIHHKTTFKYLKFLFKKEESSG